MKYILTIFSIFILGCTKPEIKHNNNVSEKIVWEDQDPFQHEYSYRAYKWVEGDGLDAAKKRCAQLTKFGYTNWRLPTRTEVHNLLQYETIDSKTYCRYYWTSEETGQNTQDGLAIDIVSGEEKFGYRGHAANMCGRCVVPQVTRY